MNLKYLLSIILVVCLLTTSANAGDSLQQLAQAIQKYGGVTGSMVGPVVSSYLQQAFQSQSFNFSQGPKETLTNKDLTVSGVTNIWGVPVDVTMVFTNLTALDLELTFSANITRFGGLKGIVDRVAQGQWKKELDELVIDDVNIAVSLKTAGKQVGLELAGSVDLSASGIYGQVLVALIKSFKNPLALQFYFPITAGGSVQEMQVRSLGSIHFSYTVPGTHELAHDIWANQITITVDLGGGSTGFDVSANVIVLAGSKNITFASTGTFQEGSPLTLQGSLTAAWTNPFGLNWITITTGTATLTLSSKPELSFTGQGTLVFNHNANINIGVSLGLQGFVLSVTGIPVDNLPQIYSAIDNGKKAPSIVSDIACQATAGITVASFNTNGFSEGITLYATETKISNANSALLKAQQQLQPKASAGSTEFKFKLFIPAFTPSEPVTISLSYDSTFPLHTGLQCTSYNIMASFGATEAPSFSINGDFAVQPKHNPQPVTFTLSGNFQVGQDATLNGQLTSNWNDAFGAKWLDITQASGTLNLAKGNNALTIDATAVFTFSGKKDTVTMSLQSGSDFTQYCFNANLNHAWNVSEVANSISSTHISTADDIATDNVDYDFTFCNYQGGASPDGVTIEISGTIVGAFLQKVRTLNPQTLPTLVFDTSLYLPFLSSDPAAFHLYLDAKDQVPINKELILQELTLIVQGGAGGYQSLEGKFQANLHNNPGPIYFDIKGDLTDSGALTLKGAETGVWNDIFGIKGFDLSNVVCELGFNPSMCSVTACISDLGIGFTQVIGTKTIIFAGNAAAPDFVDTFLLGSISAANGSLVLSMRDICKDWNRMVPKHQIDINNVPSDMGLQKASFSLAGQSGQFGSYNYQEGFHISAEINMLQMFFTIDVGCTVSNLSPSCNFQMNVNIDLNAFIAELKKYIHITLAEKYPALPKEDYFTVWKLESCGMSEFETSLLSQGTNPLWEMKFIIFDKKKDLNFRSELQDLEGSFENFYNKYIKHIF